MDKKEFEKILEKDIKKMKEVPISVDEKIKNAYQKIEEKEKETMKENKIYIMKLRQVLSIAASFVVVAFLVGNGVAYAKGEDNIYSFILQKIGIAKEYEEVKTNINQICENNGTIITIEDAALDDEFIAIRYKIKTSEYKFKNIEYYFGMDENDKEIIDINNNKIIDIGEKIIGGGSYYKRISENEYELYEMMIIEGLTDVDSLRIKMNIKNLYDYDGIEARNSYGIENPELEGNWKFDFIIRKNQDNAIREYKLNNKKAIIPANIVSYNEQQEINLLKVKQNNIVTVLEFEENSLYKNIEGYNVDNLKLGVEIIDEEGNIILENEKQILNTSIILNKIDLNKKYVINFYDCTEGNAIKDSGKKDVEGIIASMTLNINSEGNLVK